jgi:apolipoprotein N-acyltransferase
VAVEHFFPFLFPMYLGAGQHELTYFMQVCDLTGAPGTSFLVAAINAAIYVAWRGRRGAPSPRPWRDRGRAMVPAGAMVAAACIYGAVRVSMMDAAVADAPKIRVGMLQVNLGARDKTRDPTGFRVKHELMSRAPEFRDVDLLMWPESVLTVWLTPGSTSLPRGLHRGCPLLVGLVSRADEVQPRSHAMLLDERGNILGDYEKRRLVPFGEYIPMRDWLPFLDMWSPHQGNYAVGESVKPIPFREYLLAPSICYEDIHPSDVRDVMRGNGDKLPHAMVNLTNDSWYGDTTEPMQHLVLATLRCIEHRRAMARCTNTGISAFIDPAGRIVQRSDQWKPAKLVGELPMLEGDTVYGKLGNWFPLCALLVLAAAVFGYKSKAA